jgi:hypothetical protein
MHYEMDVLADRTNEAADASCRAPGPAVPPGTVMAERAAGWLRAYLDRRGLEDYRVFCSNDFDLHDLDGYLEALGGGTWEAVEPLVPGGEQPAYFSGDAGGTAVRSGVVHLRSHRAVVGSWYWYDHPRGGRWYTLLLFAAPSEQCYWSLREALLAARRRNASAAWHFVSGGSWDDERVPREAASLDALVLSNAVRQRLDAEVVGFFSERAASLYAKLGVPYRRGVLLYGPPGNGKTSIIRALAAKLPAVSGFVLRPTGSFDDDDFATVVKRWTAAAPAIFVIEDLNWLFPNRVNVSTFLNLIDGLETPRAGGLMLVASTNHPETLDPALSDRPGRFDVTLEVPSPEASGRKEFFVRALGSDAAGGLPDEATLVKLARDTAGLSFAHLREVVQAAGLAAIRDGRDARTPGDLLRAAEAVSRGHRAAGHGFPVQTEEPFGLAQFRSGARGAGDAQEGE